MRKIKRFKITARQKEILRHLLRMGGLLRQAGFTTEPEVIQYILAGFKTINPGVVYEFNQDAHWELDETSMIHKEMFSACAVTLGNQLTPFLEGLPNEDKNTALSIYLLPSCLYHKYSHPID